MPPLIILVISVLIVRTGFAYFLRSMIGEEALWWSFPAGSITSLALAAAYYRFGGWRTMHMIEGRPAAGEREHGARDAERLKDSEPFLAPVRHLGIQTAKLRENRWEKDGSKHSPMASSLSSSPSWCWS
jgi:hypothetical protein